MDTVTLHVHRFSCGRDAQAKTSSCDPSVWTVHVAWTGRQIKKTPTGAANVSLRRVRSRRVASCAPESPPSPAASPDYESPRTSPCVQDPDHWQPCHGPSLHRWHPGRSHSTVCPYGVQLIAVGAALSRVCRGCLWDWRWIIHCVSRLDPASLGYRLSCPCRICCCNLLNRYLLD